MSETKHTPGPWVIGPDAVNEARRQEHLIGLPNQPGGLSMTERIANYAANAVLIAAAPDMLEAWTDFAAVMGDLDDVDTNTAFVFNDVTAPAMNAALTKARAAIKKARGEK